MRVFRKTVVTFELWTEKAIEYLELLGIVYGRLEGKSVERNVDYGRLAYVISEVSLRELC